MTPSDRVAGRRIGQTFPFDCTPESIIKVGSTWWCSYQSWVGTWAVNLAHADHLAGPWQPWGGNPVISASGTEALLYAPEVIEHDGTFHMFYSTTGEKDIRLATASSITGTWAKQGPVLGPGSGWDGVRAGEASLVVHGGTWHMAYMGEDAEGIERVGLATASSPDGPWTRQGLTIDQGTGWDAGSIADPYLFRHDGRWWQMYAGFSPWPFPGLAYPAWRQGLAYADDPTGPWLRHRSNPILDWGTDWDERGVWRGSLVEDEGRLIGVYGGQRFSFSDFRGGTFVLDVEPRSEHIITEGGAQPPVPVYGEDADFVYSE